ncbi:hypothetical protein V6N13_036610 [Hibiscus sabdariffa]
MLAIFSTLVHLKPATATSFKREKVIDFDTFSDDHQSSLTFMGGQSRIQSGALQLTPDTINAGMLSIHYNKSGRIMSQNWTAGHGLAFLIAPNATTMPADSYGHWLGLTNASTDGSKDNQIVAIEFDTLRQPDFDPDDNHIGLDINSVESKKVASLNKYNITLSPLQGTNYSVWVDYNGTTKLMEVYMAKQGEDRPENPILKDTIDLKEYVKQDSYLGFTGSTDIIPKEEGDWWRIGLEIGVPLVIITILAAAVVCIVRYRRRRRKAKGWNKEGEDRFRKLKWLPGMPRELKYKQLKKATDNFDESMKLGEGGFGIVYKGVLNLHENNNQKHSIQVAVKKFLRDSIKGKDDFLAELAIIHRLRHRNLVRLVGWCYEKGKLLLVYDFMPNGSLDGHLYSNSSQGTLNWSHRYKILTGIASSLHYLHNEYDQKVVHCDLKPSNILLDADYNARLGDFGLARALENERHSYSELGLAGVPGTMGYVAPECFHTGKVTIKSDVFGFGAVVLEVICGRQPGITIQHQQDHYTLVDWVWMLHRERRLVEAVGERLNDEFDVDEAKRLLLLGLACSHPNASERPQTQDMFQIMSRTLSVPVVPPFKPMFQWPSSVSLSISSIEKSLSSLALSS